MVEKRRFAVGPEHPRAHGLAESLGLFHRSRITSDPGSVDGARALPDAGAPRVGISNTFVLEGTFVRRPSRYESTFVSTFESTILIGNFFR